MKRQVAAGALIAALLLSGCAPQFATPDERSESFAAPVAERLQQLDSAPDSVRVRSSYDGIVVDASLGDRSYAETRDFIDAAMPIIQDSPVGGMPVRLMLGHEMKGPQPGSGSLEWLGYDPERAERYFAAVEFWLDTLADPGVQFDDPVQVQAAYVFGAIVVLDGRDLNAYRAEVIARLEQAGYVNPSITVRSNPTP